ncbi:MAG: HTH-type transcriptional repressor PurR [Lentisphaerae bacterium ADurb.Bin242]|nr:MAG: HTH-type transcriptional repressor PurR [Lentisphaerae bacterium ADurb.Bin242]
MPRKPNQEVIDSLRKEILSGRYDHSSFLPSERQLAADFEEGRGVIRTALRNLCGEGLLEIIPQRGICIRKERREKRLRHFLVRQHSFSRDAHETFGILVGICDAASRNYAEAILSFCPPCPDIRELVARYRRNELQGIIFIERPDTPAEQLNSSGIPWVVANRELAFDAVFSGMDFRSIGRLAGQRLLAAGHRRIGTVTGPLDTFIFKEMLAGFRGALAEEEVLLNPDWVIPLGSDSVPGPGGKLYGILSSPERPTAFFAMRDHRAAKLYDACSRFGLKIPQDLSVIGYDDVSWPLAEAHGLTTIRQETHAIGSSSVELLKEWFETGTPPKSRVFTGALVERSSIDKPSA